MLVFWRPGRDNSAIVFSPEGDKIAFRDRAWEVLEIQRDKPVYNEDLSRPDALNDLINTAEQLSPPFPFCRVHFYLVENQIRFGEMTFYPMGGYIRFRCDADERRFGDLLVLPEPTNARWSHSQGKR